MAGHCGNRTHCGKSGHGRAARGPGGFSHILRPCRRSEIPSRRFHCAGPETAGPGLPGRSLQCRGCRRPLVPSAQRAAAPEAEDHGRRHDDGKTTCLGPCNLAPVVQVFPEGTYYGGVTEAAIDRIITEHLLGGMVLEDFAYHPTGRKQRLRSLQTPSFPNP